MSPRDDYGCSTVSNIVYLLSKEKKKKKTIVQVQKKKKHKSLLMTFVRHIFLFFLCDERKKDSLRYKISGQLLCAIKILILHLLHREREREREDRTFIDSANVKSRYRACTRRGRPQSCVLLHCPDTHAHTRAFLSIYATISLCRIPAK